MNNCAELSQKQQRELLAAYITMHCGVLYMDQCVSQSLWLVLLWNHENSDFLTSLNVLESFGFTPSSRLVPPCLQSKIMETFQKKMFLQSLKFAVLCRRVCMDKHVDKLLATAANSVFCLCFAFTGSDPAP